MNVTRSKVLGIVVALVLSCGLVMAAVTSALADQAKSETRTFVDSAGRTVEIPAEITAVAPSGPLAQMVLLTFDPSILCGLATSPDKNVEKYFNIKADDYIIFGQIYGGKGGFNKEEVAAAGTQLIIDIGEAKKTIVEDLDQLQADTGIPCIHIESSISTYDQVYLTLGEIFGNTERGAELAKYCKAAYAKTQAVVEKIDKADYAKVAFITDETHAIAKGSYQGQVVDNCAENVVVFDDVVGNGIGNEISLEQLAVWDPDILFIADAELYGKVADDPTWSTLTAVENGKYYFIPNLPYGWLNSPPSVNQLLGTQWFPRVCSPELFDDSMQDVVSAYYKALYNYELSDAEWAEIAATSAPAALDAAA
ncbi:MAG: ABC transporter substrate-binding protein [Coriobacteriales bacterium]|nr:ABC transporter substrate-binding protein [Coriobacteriales bacterium]